MDAYNLAVGNDAGRTHKHLADYVVAGRLASSFMSLGPPPAGVDHRAE